MKKLFCSVLAGLGIWCFSGMAPAAAAPMSAVDEVTADSMSAYGLMLGQSPDEVTSLFADSPDWTAEWKADYQLVLQRDFHEGDPLDEFINVTVEDGQVPMFTVSLIPTGQVSAQELWSMVCAKMTDLLGEGHTSVTAMSSMAYWLPEQVDSSGAMVEVNMSKMPKTGEYYVSILRFYPKGGSK